MYIYFEELEANPQYKQQLKAIYKFKGRIKLPDPCNLSAK